MTLSDTRCQGLISRVTLDPDRGVIRQLVDKRTGRDWVDDAAPHAFGQYLYERFDRDQVAAYVKAYVKIDTPTGPSTSWANPTCRPQRKCPIRPIAPAGFKVRYEQSARWRSRLSWSRCPATSSGTA